MTKIAHISDLHFGRIKKHVLAGLLNSLSEQQPELVVISGDLTQRARNSEFRAAAAYIKQLGQTCLVIPGNHDLAAFNLLERFGFPWKKWRQFISKEFQPMNESSGYIAIGLNTARVWGSFFDWSRGRISIAQVTAVHEKFKGQSAQQLRLLVAHHPFWLPIDQEHRQLIGGRDAALEFLRGGELDLILSGHVHLAYTQVLEGIIISHAGTSSSDRLLPGQPNSYNLINGDRNDLVIKTFAWNGAAFASTQTAKFTRVSSYWLSSNP